MKKKVTYEQPLNEHVRNLLRLEYLFEGITYRLKGPAAWDTRDVMRNLVELAEFVIRYDLKPELLQDLAYHSQILQRWKTMPDVDTERLTGLLAKTDGLVASLNNFDGQILDNLAQHYLLNTIKQRASIPGGVSNSDLPNYHHWLQKSPKQRQSEISDWLMPLTVLRDAVEFNLYMLRNSAIVSQEVAHSGFFQSKLDSDVEYQLIRVNLVPEHSSYPEISGSKQRVTIRFFEQNNVKDRPTMSEQDVYFELCCCMI